MHEIYLRRIGTEERALGRVVAKMGPHPNGILYGLGTAKSCEALWGVRFSSSFYEKLLNTMTDGVYFVNRDRKITYWNEGAGDLTGYRVAEALGKHCFDNFLCHIDAAGKPLCGEGCPLGRAMSEGQEIETELYLRHKNGHRVPICLRVLPMRNDAGEIVGAVEVFSDSTLKKRAEKRVLELENLAFRDSLTNLPNRRYLELKVAQALQDHQQLQRNYGLLLFDLDSFKQVNDAHGHAVGDALLNVVAQTVVQGLRPIDVVGRWGGEEFLVLMPDVNAVALGDMAERCRILIAKSSVASGAAQVSVTASIGATLLIHTDTAEQALSRADQLMYESKRSGGDRTTAG
jgi:diguanylate cyclase (GGDEF)-like protein/PAS domain S-box-containing protein